MFSTQSITPADIEQMILHWLKTPQGSYFGSNYGSNLKDPLQRPLLDMRMDEVIEKMKADIPILGVLGSGAVSLMAYEGSSLGEVDLVIEVLGLSVPVPKD